MRLRIPTSLVAGAAAVLAFGLAAPMSASAAPGRADLSPYLSKQLSSLSGKTTVLVHGATLADANRAVTAAGMTKSVTFRKIDVVGAVGTRAQIQALRSQAGVEYVEAGAQPIEFYSTTSNQATRGLEATRTVTGADGSALTGQGVSVGVIDGEPRLDLMYTEDVRAETDMNVVVTGKGEFIEVQGTAEGAPFRRDELDALLDLAVAGCAELAGHQQDALGR